MAKTWPIWALIWGKKMNNPEHIQLNTLQMVQLELKAPKKQEKYIWQLYVPQLRRYP